ncbi:MAG: protein kinase [Verrucomicrobiales bacterium]|nr:protein kinase [Verrucomicrobiales bacterium]
MSEENPPTPEPDPPTPAQSTGLGFTAPTIDEMNAALPQFEFTELLGLGGMGAVYKARQPKLNRFVAIKVLPPIPDDDLGFAERFEREAQAMASLSHPHIVGVHDFGETEDGQLYFVMEFIEGADLHKLIVGGQLTLDHFYGWIPQICEALAYAHKNGIVHRDIKPANILINSEGVVKMADFGLAKLTGPQESVTALTRADLSMGTPDYAAPEQIESTGSVDWRADIYSVGVIMYQLLTGRVPRGAFPAPSEENAHLDPRLDGVVLKAMQSKPDDRFQTASDISTKLTEIRTTARTIPVKKPASTGDSTNRQNTRPVPMPASTGFPVKRFVAFVVMAILMIATVIGGASALKKRQAEKERQANKTIGENAAPSSKINVDVNIEKNPTAKTNDQIAAERAKAERDKEKQKEIERKQRERDREDQMARANKGRGPRPQGLGGDRPGFSAFRDKLGGGGGFKKTANSFRKLGPNLLGISRVEGAFPLDDPLVQVPKDLARVKQLQIGQAPQRIRDDGIPPFALALLTTGEVVAWGDNFHGQTELPEFAGPVTHIAAGTTHALALTADGKITAWGSSEARETNVPADLPGVTQIVAGNLFSAALTENGTIRVWGRFPADQIPADLTGVQKIAAGYDQLVALTADGAVLSWGAGRFSDNNVPPMNSRAIDVVATAALSAALLENGRVLVWGPIQKGNPISNRADENAVEIAASGDIFAYRVDDSKWELRGPGSNSLFVPTPIKNAPGKMNFAVAPQIAFVFKTTTQDLETTTSAPAPVEPIPVPEPEPEPEFVLDPESEAGKRIADLQEKFEAAFLEQVVEYFEGQEQYMQKYYQDAVTREQPLAAQAQDLDLAVALKAEIDRLAELEAVSVPEVDEPDTPPKLKEMRNTLRDALAKLAEERAAKEADLFGRFKSALGDIQGALTAENLLDDAQTVRAFVETLD